jgi:protein SCO1/2
MKMKKLIILLFVACQRVSAPPPPRAAVGTGDSIYALDLPGLDAYRGHPVIISMFYGRCPSACPMLVSTIQWIEDRIPAKTRDDLRVLLVSFDAEHDTPAALDEMAARHEIDRARWRLTSLPEDDARALANVLGIHYRRIGDQFQHDVVVTLLDADGRIVTSARGTHDALDVISRKLAP